MSGLRFRPSLMHAELLEWHSKSAIWPLRVACSGRNWLQIGRTGGQEIAWFTTAF